MSRIGIECVTVSAGYGDFLREIAPINRALLDRWVIVTEPSDEETKQVCRDFSLECIVTDELRQGGEFNKARAINRGLDQLTGDGWLMHLDGDIALPYDFRECLHGVGLREGNIYGCDRLCVTGWDNWQKVKQQGLYSRQHGWLVEKNRPGAWVGGVPAGRETAWTPIGFLQLWHGSETLTWKFPRKRYPETHGHAARTDCQFSLLWDRANRIFMPELVVFHIESDDAKMGINWKGRKSARFTPPTATSKPAESRAY